MKEYFDNPELKKDLDFSPSLAEKMIRVEQRVSSSFGKYLTFDNTDYYKALTPKQRTLFENFQRKKQKKKIFSYSLVIIPLLLISMMNFGVTGNVVNENLSTTQLGAIEIILLVIALLALSLIVYVFIIKKVKEKILERNYKIIGDTLVQKKMTKKIK